MTLKRLFDVTVSTLLLIALIPILALVALMMRVLYGSPVIFRQERVGLGGRIFRIHKFRTMTLGTGAQVTSDNDTRIHTGGKMLRATKLDELPQLWDVLLGQMSLVGPRPEVPKYVNHWPADAREKIVSVKPGITDPASVAYRHESVELARAEDPERHYVDVILPRKVRMYVDYINTRSFSGDLLILFRTATAVVSRRASEGIGKVRLEVGGPR